MTGSRIDALSGWRTTIAAGSLARAAVGAWLAAAALMGCGGSKASSTGASSARAPTTRSTTATTAPAPSVGVSHEVSPGVVRSAAQDVSATMNVSGHRPKVDAAWPVHLIVTRAGKPAKAEVRYQYLFAGQVVARRSHYRFKGAFHDVFKWPPSAVGYPLTFRAVVTSAGVTLDLDYPVQVQR